jgi:NHL repeat-containing protein
MKPRLLWVLLLCTSLCHAEGIITTIAGGGQFQVTGIGGPATSVPLGLIQGIAADPQGNVYVSDAADLIVVEISTTGVLTIVAGNGTSGLDGDGGPAINASLSSPGALATDISGNLFIADSKRIRKVTPQGVISTVAGDPSLCTSHSPCYSGDGGPATRAAVSFPRGLALDTRGNLYLTDGFSRIRKVDAQGIITTIAGNGLVGDTGDGGPAVNAALFFPSGIAVDQNGVIYFTESGGSSRIRRIGTDGIIATIAGGNGDSYSGDGGPAVAAALNSPAGIALGPAGDLYIADSLNNRIRQITPAGIIHTLAGTGVPTFTGDQGPASFASLSSPLSVASDAFGNVYLGDSYNYRVRKIDSSRTIATYAGNGKWNNLEDGAQARGAVLSLTTDVVVDGAGTVYFLTGDNRVFKIAPDGTLTTLVGNHPQGFAGDGGPVSRALFTYPWALALDREGNLYIADNTSTTTGSARVRKVDSNGIVTTVAGNGTAPGSGNGDGGAAVNASLGWVAGLTFDAKGNMYLTDDNRIRQVSPEGTITTFATVPITVGGLNGRLAVDAAGNVYSTVFAPDPITGFNTGNLTRFSRDGTTMVLLRNHFGFGKTAFDSQGNLYVPSGDGSIVFRLSSGGAQTLVAGTGRGGFSGDDGPATLAQLWVPTALAVDTAGNLYIADLANNRIRKVFLNPASGLFEPTLQTTLQPGYYTATVELGQGEHAGYWGMEILAPVGVFAGGLNLGGTLQQRSLPPGFGGFFLPTPQTVHLHVDARPVDGGDTSNIQLGVRLLDVNKKPVTAEKFGGTSVDFTETLPAGYYDVEARGGDNSPLENFLMSVEAPQLSGGVVVGGFAGAHTVGYSGFYLTAPQQITIRMYGQPSYGADGAGGLRLTLYDAVRNVIATVP